MDLADGYAPVLRCVSEFTLGLLAWRSCKHDLMGSRWLPMLTGAAILFLLAIRRSDIGIVLLLPVFIASLSHEGSLAAKALGSRPLRWLGEISYSLYLVHTLCLNGKPHALRLLVSHHVPHPTTIYSATFLVVTLALAQTTYLLIEQPGRSLLRGIFEFSSPSKSRTLQSLPALSSSER
jgi:peptidoglycan/LPS O-acetylase OafA/YrhL